ncbi:MAG TPA: GNAT family N-acetyltransferase [Devosiaceae bacterium]|nr:GNAT family N-acetyltransferase [Devosiaceae bacterium]
MPDAPLIRTFAWGDVPAITAIYAHYVRSSVATFDLEAPGEAYIAEKWGSMIEAGHPAIVAEREGKLVGFAYASVYRTRPGYRFTCEDTVYIAPDFVGQGIGSALLDEVIHRAGAFGFRQMIGVIADEIEASVKLHEKHGFAVLGRFPALGYKFDRWIGVIHMQREL